MAQICPFCGISCATEAIDMHVESMHIDSNSDSQGRGQRSRDQDGDSADFLVAQCVQCRTRLPASACPTHAHSPLQCLWDGCSMTLNAQEDIGSHWMAHALPGPPAVVAPPRLALAPMFKPVRVSVSGPVPGSARRTAATGEGDGAGGLRGYAEMQKRKWNQQRIDTSADAELGIGEPIMSHSLPVSIGAGTGTGTGAGTGAAGKRRKADVNMGEADPELEPVLEGHCRRDVQLRLYTTEVSSPTVDVVWRFKRASRDLQSKVHPRVHKSITRMECCTCPQVVHFASSGFDSGWGCGWRAAQMLISGLMSRLAYSRALFGGTVPSLLTLQETLEKAWAAGFDAVGAQQLGGTIVRKQKWVGASDMAALLLYSGVRAKVTDFKFREVDAARCALFTWIRRYFDGDGDGDGVGGVERGLELGSYPLYLQWKGHAIAVFGYEIRNTAKSYSDISLLVLDSSHKAAQLEAALTSGHLDLFRRKSFFSKAEFQVLYVQGDRLLSEPEKMASRVIRSDRIDR